MQERLQLITNAEDLEKMWRTETTQRKQKEEALDRLQQEHDLEIAEVTTQLKELGVQMSVYRERFEQN